MIYAPRKPVPPVTRTFAVEWRLFIPVISFTCLSAQAAFFHLEALDGRGLQSVRPSQGIIYGFADGVVDIVPDQIHQSEGAHPEAGRFHQGVDGFDIGQPFLQQPERLEIIGSRDMVDNEAGGIGAADGGLPHAPRKMGDLVDAVVGRILRPDDLHQLHKRGRIEKVHARESFGSRDLFSKRIQGKRRGIGCEYRFGPVDGGKLCEQAELDFRFFDDCLDDDVTPAIPEISGIGKTSQDQIPLSGPDLIPFHKYPEVLFNRVSPFLHHLFIDIVQEGRIATRRSHLRNPAAHRTRSTNDDCCDHRLILHRPRKLSQEADIILGIEAKVIYPVFELADPLNPHAKGEAGVFAAVDTEVVEHLWMNHPAAQDLDPTGMFAYATADAATDKAADIHLRAWFRKREIGRAETDADIFAEHLLD